MVLLVISTAQVIKRLQFFTIQFYLANCTLGEWADWGECEPSFGDCGNGSRLRYKKEVLHSRNGGSCDDKIPEVEKCTVDCSPSANTG